MKLRFSEFALEDLQKIVEWYDLQSSELGDLFLNEFEVQKNKILLNPKLYQKIIMDVRRASLINFPYGIYYVIKDNLVVIVGIIHFKRDQKEILDRLN